MITAPAAFTFLLLSFQTCRLVNGEDPTATIMEGGSAERQTRTNLRLPQKEKDADDSSIGTRSMQEVDVQDDDVLGDDVLAQLRHESLFQLLHNAVSIDLAHR